MEKMENKKKFVSLIIPAYKQERTISEDLMRIRDSLDQLRYDYEIIVVVDGKVDKTFEKAKKFESSRIRILGYDINHGKGYAIRYGMKQAKGNIIGFIDAGMDLNPNGLSILLERFEWHDADIVIGSKRHPESKVTYPFVRRSISFFSQLFIRILFGLNVRDTQVGMKFFKKKVIKDVLPRLLVKEFAFDIEILVVAYYLGYRKIYEAPIELHHNFKSSIVSQSLISAILRTFWDSLAIFYRLKIVHYYDKIKK
jgi:glycosyltransferase involved in cell wall biosynthesis